MTAPHASVKKVLLVSPQKIHTLRFILEAHEGIAVVTTLDAPLGLVQLSIAPGCLEDLDRILDGERENLGLRGIEGIFPNNTP